MWHGSESVGTPANAAVHMFVMERNRDTGSFVDLSDLCSSCPLFGVNVKREHWRPRQF